jgi:hypothetical protein
MKAKKAKKAAESTAKKAQHSKALATPTPSRTEGWTALQRVHPFSFRDPDPEPSFRYGKP